MFGLSFATRRPCKGTESVIGISFNMTNMGEVCTSNRAFEGMPILRFLRIYRSWLDNEGILQIPEAMKYLPRLRLLHWQNYPIKSLPPIFQTESRGAVGRNPAPS